MLVLKTLQRNENGGRIDSSLGYKSAVLLTKTFILWSSHFYNCTHWTFLSSSQRKVDAFISTVHLPHPFKTEMNKVLVFTEVKSFLNLPRLGTWEHDVQQHLLFVTPSVLNECSRSDHLYHRSLQARFGWYSCRAAEVVGYNLDVHVNDRNEWHRWGPPHFDTPECGRNA